MSTKDNRAPRHALLVLAAAGGLVLATALPAWGHVTVSSPDATPGGFGKLVFRVPTESDSASTTRLQVTLPGRSPFAEVATKPLPGWTVTSKERPLGRPVQADGFTLTKAVRTVTWTAGPGKGVKPGQFEEFELSVGPFPKGETSIALPVIQTYSDGTTVRWNQPTVAGEAEPEHPAPTLTLAQGTAPGTQDAHGTGDTPDTPDAGDTGDTGDSTDVLARWLGGIGIVVGLAGLVAAARSRRRRA